MSTPPAQQAKKRSLIGDLLILWPVAAIPLVLLAEDPLLTVAWLVGIYGAHLVLQGRPAPQPGAEPPFLP